MELSDLTRPTSKVVWITLSPDDAALVGGWAPAALMEATYREIADRIDPDFLQQKIRADALAGIRLAGFNGDEMSFWVKSSEYDTGPRGRNLRYLNTVRFLEWEDIGSDLTMRPIDRSRMLMFAGNLQLNCTCPSFLYHGYRYLLDQIGASLIPEPRPPVRNNPNMRGIVCKHMNRVLRSFPFYSGVLAKEVRGQFGATGGRAQVADQKSQRAEQLRRDMAAGRVIDADFEEIV
jgi:hypothetical protein